ncbi:hypothetical protein GOQ29_13950 [Clostridium sp. D2Q-14]|uniref:hypothetical protein n=1 Tax=Anaeromonas gelatinilytica TaxID=2683194 RepID=UPI00193B5F93|nr:hypothetical protein [Anaeromonas gelatinilytica]MBS4536722.1 hypothetical protein [Anaeromonas gelatinilytica]
MGNKLVKISIKGSIMIMFGIGFINLVLVAMLSRLGINERMIIILFNTVFSSALVSYIITFIDKNGNNKEKFFSRYIKFVILFGLTAFLWTKGIFI